MSTPYYARRSSTRKPDARKPDNALNPDEPTQPAPPSPARLRSFAFALLGRREWSRAALCEKLLTTGAALDDINVLLDELAERNDQSDARTASMAVRSNIRKGRGPARIKQDLKTRALDPALATEELADTDWVSLARQLREKKFGPTWPTDRKEQARQLRFLQYRGFDGDTCRKACQAAEPWDD